MALLRADIERNDQPSHDDRTADMVRIPGGTFRMGSNDHYPEEAPVHRVTVDGFWIDRTPVTNRQFKQFVRATGHVTTAEVPPDPHRAASTFSLSGDGKRAGENLNLAVLDPNRVCRQRLGAARSRIPRNPQWPAFARAASGSKPTPSSWTVR